LAQFYVPMCTKFNLRTRNQKSESITPLSLQSKLESLFYVSRCERDHIRQYRPGVFQSTRDRAGHIGDIEMKIAQWTSFQAAQREVRSHDLAIMLGYQSLRSCFCSQSI